MGYIRTSFGECPSLSLQIKFLTSAKKENAAEENKSRGGSGNSGVV